MNKCLVFCGALLVASFSMLGKNVQKPTIYSTTPTARWTVGKCELAMTDASTSLYTVYVDSIRQEVTGFGGTFNEISWDAILTLPQEMRDALMKDLFGPDGINFAIGRTPMGCSDYSFGYYSYNDVKDDYSMRNFTISQKDNMLAFKAHDNHMAVVWYNPDDEGKDVRLSVGEGTYKVKLNPKSINTIII